MPYHLDDIEADFRTFYGLEPEDIVRMTGPHFFALVWRLGVYEGALAARMTQSVSSTAPDRVRGADTVVASTPAALGSDPAFAGMVSFGTG